MEILDTRVLIVGAGAAGLRAALELVARGVPCLVVGKRRYGDAHTRMAAGGINAAFGTRDPEDSWIVHAADTLREGHFLNDPRAVELLARDAPARVGELAGWGCPFERTSEGELEQRYFGAQTFRRTCFVGDCTGEAILRTLVNRARALRVGHRDGVFVTRLILDEGRVAGAVGFDRVRGAWLAIHAEAVVLAAGGATSIYRRSTSRPDENTGDAVALALDAGAALRDLEMVQFHPTGLMFPEDRRGELVTEAMRGEGAHLLNAQRERFMERYSPDSMELDARDVVARAIERELRAGRGTAHGGVFIDISHRGREHIERRLPKLRREMLRLGVDLTEEPLEVAPTAHYVMGGIAADPETGATSVPGLYAVGEAAGGVHGANRLGGNSLAETLVFGRRTGRFLSQHLTRGARRFGPPSQAALERALGPEAAALPSTAPGEGDPTPLLAELRELMWRHGGILRSAAGLQEGLQNLHDLAARAASVAPRRCEAPSERLEAAYDLGFMLQVGEAVLRAALAREESRGAHFREDAPDARADWRVTLLVERAEDGGLALSTRPLPPVPEELEGELAKERRLDYHHLE